MGPMPPITRAILISGALVFVLQSVLGEHVFIQWMLWPLGEYTGQAGNALVTVGFMPWQLLSYGFLHGSPAHAFFNLFAVYMFGTTLEQTWGSRRFAFYWFACVAGAGLVQLAVATHAAQSGEGPYPTLGASGGVFGLLLAYGMLFPHHRLMLIFPPIPMKAWVFVLCYGVLELVLGLSGAQTGVAHFAHLGGMAAGFFILQYWRGRWPFARRR